MKDMSDKHFTVCMLMIVGIIAYIGFEVLFK